MDQEPDRNRILENRPGCLRPGAWEEARAAFGAAGVRVTGRRSPRAALAVAAVLTGHDVESEQRMAGRLPPLARRRGARGRRSLPVLADLPAAEQRTGRTGRRLDHQGRTACCRAPRGLPRPRPADLPDRPGRRTPGGLERSSGRLRTGSRDRQRRLGRRPAGTRSHGSGKGAAAARPAGQGGRAARRRDGRPENRRPARRFVVGDLYCMAVEACYELADVHRAREWTAALVPLVMHSHSSCATGGSASCTGRRCCSLPVTGSRRWTRLTAPGRTVGPEAPARSRRCVLPAG